MRFVQRCDEGISASSDTEEIDVKTRPCELENRYKTARNKRNQAICNALHRLILLNIDFSSSSSVWNFFGALGIGNKQNPDFKNTLCLSGINRNFSSITTFDPQIIFLTLTHIINFSLDSGTFLSIWRKIYIIPLA